MTSRRLAVFCLAMVILSACASGGRVGPSRYYPQDKETIWFAALDAVDAIGARIRIENRTSGIIAATLSVDSMGGSIELNISVSSELSGGNVQVKAVDRHASELDEARLEDLKFIEEQYLDFIDINVGRYGRRGAGITHRPYLSGQ